jgi:hypothetical protein
MNIKMPIIQLAEPSDPSSLAKLAEQLAGKPQGQRILQQNAI